MTEDLASDIGITLQASFPVLPRRLYTISPQNSMFLGERFGIVLCAWVLLRFGCPIPFHAIFRTVRGTLH